MFDDAPAAPVIAERRSDGYWSLTVFRCPWCGGVHRHGGGDGAAPQLGHKTSNCCGKGCRLVLVERSTSADVCKGVQQ